jgi:antitoxin component YwqK of YwqJK toxin-antitoxin module
MENKKPKNKRPINKQGNRHGHWESYWSNGQVKTIGDYDDGEKIGIHKDFYANGDLDEFNEYFGNGLVYSLSFHSDNEVAYKGYYTDGLEIGYWYENFWREPSQHFYYAR